MVINHASRWVYLGPPKTGTTSLTYVLTDGNDWRKRSKVAPHRVELFRGLKHRGQHCMDVPPECSSYFIFASIRNPYTRAVSLWSHWNREAKQRRRPPLSLEQFLTIILECQDDTRAARLAGNGFFHFILGRWFKWVERIDAFIRQESLEADLNNLNLGPPVRLPWQHGSPQLLHPTPHNGAGRATESLAVYSLATVKMVQQWAAADFARFDYPREFSASAMAYCKPV